MLREARRFYTLIAAATLLVLLGGTAEAFWGFGQSGEPGKSGLDLEQGYDRNTVVTVGGTVAVAPRPLAGGIMAFDLSREGEQVVVVLGPAWYLQDDDLNWKVGSQVTVRGSLAQGKDGRLYLITERILTPNGTTLMLRGGDGTPSWSGQIRSGQQGGAGWQTPRGGGAGGRHGR